MEIGFTIRNNQYYDSVFLMGTNNKISEVDGVINSAVLMGTESNKKLLSEIGVNDPQIDKATPNDLIVTLIAESEEIIRLVLDDLDHWFEGAQDQTSEFQLKTLEDGLGHKPGANLVAISVPGEYAFREAKKALEKGLNVFLFSSNVPISEELALKQYAHENGLLVMGPDCGTSIIGGVGIGFANKVRKGNIGVVGASGTGLQEYTSLVHNAGFGISHAIGTGSHDLSDDIGGITTLAALEALEKDPTTQVIAIISKPPGIDTLKLINNTVSSFSKPVIGCFLGLGHTYDQELQSIILARNVDKAVLSTINALGGQIAGLGIELGEKELSLLEDEKSKFSQSQKYVRGVFAGGTFCYQAQQIFQDSGIDVFSNTPISTKWALSNPDISKEHTLVDMGDDLYTVSRPHPMIDGTFRWKRILEESKDALVAVLLIDIILGFNASTDPVGDIIDAIIEAKQLAQTRGDHLCVVASVCGTDEDFQSKALQVEILEQAGVIVFNSNSKAASFCAKLLD
ncbi:MAG: acyl-CoA synthetase FdrA [Chloroflexi bacterium]|nr:acyl-CoA synthetase FdrA [Chloroflexota bacterium]